jgi:hypothetical protein
LIFCQVLIWCSRSGAGKGPNDKHHPAGATALEERNNSAAPARVHCASYVAPLGPARRNRASSSSPCGHSPYPLAALMCPARPTFTNSLPHAPANVLARSIRTYGSSSLATTILREWQPRQRHRPEPLGPSRVRVRLHVAWPHQQRPAHSPPHPCRPNGRPTRRPSCAPPARGRDRIRPRPPQAWRPSRRSAAAPSRPARHGGTRGSRLPSAIASDRAPSSRGREGSGRQVAWAPLCLSRR